MAVAPPLVYADQAYSIIKKRWVLAVVHAVVTPVDANCMQGLDRVLPGCMRNPVRPARLRIDPPSQLTISCNRLGRPSPLLLRREIKPHRQYHKMFLLAGGSVRNAAADTIDTHDLGPGT